MALNNGTAATNDTSKSSAGSVTPITVSADAHSNNLPAPMKTLEESQYTIMAGASVPSLENRRHGMRISLDRNKPPLSPNSSGKSGGISTPPITTPRSDPMNTTVTSIAIPVPAVVTNSSLNDTPISTFITSADPSVLEYSDSDEDVDDEQVSNNNSSKLNSVTLVESEVTWRTVPNPIYNENIMKSEIHTIEPVVLSKPKNEAAEDEGW